MAYLAHNLSVIRTSIRNHFSPDPTIYWMGDRRHSARTSDHNPDGGGMVHAIDVMYSTGAKASSIVKACVGRWDLKYVIHNRTIWTASNGWRPRRYTGSDPHTNHVHISGKYDSASEKRSLGLTFPGSTPPTKNPVTVPKFPGLLRRGSKGAGVKALQTQLNKRGYQHVTVDGDFGPATEDRVRDFQLYAKIHVDGMVGPVTWNKLFTLRIS